MSHKPIKQLTLRGFGPELEKRIRELARRDDLSLNKAALALLSRGAGISRDKQARDVPDGLEKLFGSWTQEEADAFDGFMQDFERIDPSFWK